MGISQLSWYRITSLKRLLDDISNCYLSMTEHGIIDMFTRSTLLFLLQLLDRYRKMEHAVSRIAARWRRMGYDLAF